MTGKPSWSRAVAAGAVAVGLTVLLGALSQVPYDTDSAANAAVRLTWRMRGVRVEECRRLTPEELDEIPAHMRQEEVCEGRIIPHRLVVSLDDAVVVDEFVRSAGARADRPLYVFHDLSVPAGEHRVAVAFVREGAGSVEADQGAAPARLELETTLVLDSKEVALITYDAESRSLVVKGYGTGDGSVSR